MAGQIKKMLDAIIAQRSKGNPTLAITTKTKLLFKGIDADKYTASSPDDPDVVARLRVIAGELGVRLS